MSRGVGRSFVVAVWTFVLSVAMNAGSRAILVHLPLLPSFGLLLAIVLVGILFDVIGVAATAAQESPFHAMAADKVPGANHAIWIVRNADKVANFANDMVGDIAGTLSGAVAAMIVFRLLLLNPGASETLLAMLVLGVVAALTVGGKAYAKTFAVHEAQQIVHAVGRVLHLVYTLVGLRVSGAGGKRGKNRRRRGAGRTAKDGRK